MGSNSEPIILDRWLARIFFHRLQFSKIFFRLQAQLHALATDSATYLEDPQEADGLDEEWTAFLGQLELDRRQGEISELMINNANIR